MWYTNTSQLTTQFRPPQETYKSEIGSQLFFFFSFSAHFYSPASGQAVVTGVIPSPPRLLPSIFIAHRVQQSHCSSIVHRMLLTYDVPGPYWCMRLTILAPEKSDFRWNTACHPGRATTYTSHLSLIKRTWDASQLEKIKPRKWHVSCIFCLHMHLWEQQQLTLWEFDGAIVLSQNIQKENVCTYGSQMTG